MLTEQALKTALQDGATAAGVCRAWCRQGATVGDGQYRIHHNGIGSSDTSEQVVTNTITLALSPSQMTDRFKAWLEALHRHAKYDLNTGGAPKG